VPLASPINASLIFGLSFSLLLYIVSYLMYPRKWFIRI
jgi:predicted acyltransferase